MGGGAFCRFGQPFPFGRLNPKSHSLSISAMKIMATRGGADAPVDAP
jgi:hypothetical protein